MLSIIVFLLWLYGAMCLIGTLCECVGYAAAIVWTPFSLVFRKKSRRAKDAETPSGQDRRYRQRLRVLDRSLGLRH